MHLIAIRMANSIQPQFAIQADRVYNESVSLPMANGVTVIAWCHVGWMLAAVDKDMAHAVIVFEEFDYFFGSLHDLHRKELQIDVRHTGRITLVNLVGGFIERDAARPLRRLRILELFLAPGSHRRGGRAGGGGGGRCAE